MKPYQALIWNEWRQMRGMFLAAMGAMILLWLTLLVLNMLRVRDIDMVALVISWLLPVLLAFIGFGTFQSELKSETDSFLLALPISRGRIFWYKYLFNLSIYIVLAVFCALLFLPMTLDDAISKLTAQSIVNTVSLIFAVIYLAVHAMTVTAPLLQNNRGSKAGGWAIALAFLALVIGIQAIVPLYPCNETRWIGVTVFLTALSIGISALALGYYLWINCIAFKRNIIRTLLVAAGILVLFSVILFTIGYAGSGLDLAAAKREAQAAGLILEMKPAAAAAMKNDALLIPLPLRQYQTRLDTVKPKLPSRSNKNDDYSWLAGKGKVQLSLDLMQQAADFILNDPTAIKLYTELYKALNNPYCRFDSPLLMQKEFSCNAGSLSYETRLSSIDVIRNFLHDRAYALELVDRTTEAFECLELLDKLADSIDYHQNRTSWDLVQEIKSSKFKAVAEIGPDSLAEVKYYEKLLQELASMRPEFYDDTAELIQKLPGSNIVISHGPIELLRNLETFLLQSRYRETIADFLRCQLVYKQLFERAVTEKFTEIKGDVLNWQEQCSRLSFLITRTFESPIKRCYMQRLEIATMKLHLASKIYKAKYGHFPDTLAELAPEILPEIPFNPYTGENFKYKAASNGFSMEIMSFLLFSRNNASISLHLFRCNNAPIMNLYSYHTWNRNTDTAVLSAAKAEVSVLPQNKRRRTPAPELTNTKEKAK